MATEAGFGTELGAEKFFHIKCRASGLRPHVAVLVTTVRGNKVQSGRYGQGRRAAEDLAREDPDALEAGLPNLAKPVCMAKTPLSLSADPGLLGRPQGFTVEVRDLRLFAGVGFVVALLGDVQTMPGLARHPLGEEIDIDERGAILGVH